MSSITSEKLDYTLFLSEKDLFPESISGFLMIFEDGSFPNLYNGVRFNFRLDNDDRENKITPILQLAEPDDAKEISEMFKNVYKGTYPYKEFEDNQEVQRMIEGHSHHFILFKENLDTIAGFFMARVDLDEKRGYIGRLVLKKEYLGRIDLMNGAIGAMLIIYKMYKGKIFLWYGETRTAHSKSQYLTAVCGAKPIAFFPNKDIFFNKVESDLMQIIYKKKELAKYRRKDYPNIIPEVVNCYWYSDRRYNLGPVQFNYQEINLDQKRIKQLKKNLEVKKISNNFGYEIIIYSIKNSNAYFKFLYTHQLLNIERTIYKINSLEELLIFIQELKNFMEEFEIRYFECFVSAYKPLHQRIFLESGFVPRGYVPCWKYNKKLKFFEDHIVFNFFKGFIDKNIQLIPDGFDLLKALDLHKE